MALAINRMPKDGVVLVYYTGKEVMVLEQCSRCAKESLRRDVNARLAKLVRTSWPLVCGVWRGAVAKRGDGELSNLQAAVTTCAKRVNEY